MSAESMCDALYALEADYMIAVGALVAAGGMMGAGTLSELAQRMHDARPLLCALMELGRRCDAATLEVLIRDHEVKRAKV